MEERHLINLFSSTEEETMSSLNTPLTTANLYALRLLLARSVHQDVPALVSFTYDQPNQGTRQVKELYVTKVIEGDERQYPTVIGYTDGEVQRLRVNNIVDLRELATALV
jgi:hypothetical protein